MKTQFRASFGRDIKRIHDAAVLAGIRQAILALEAAISWNDVPAIKKIKGTNDAFRIRVDDYRIGLYVEHDTAELVRVLRRRDIYRKFP